MKRLRDNGITVTAINGRRALLLLVAALFLLISLPAVSSARYAYVTNDTFTNPDPLDRIIRFTISQFDIDPATGMLAATGPQIVDEGTHPDSIAITPNGKNAYVVNSSTLGPSSIT